jgi:hypothetical protein
MKCANEKALYEHVSRLHGGKGVFNQPQSQKSGGGEPDYDDYDDDEHENESDEDEDDAYLSSNSDMSTPKKPSNKNSSNKKELPRPNVAIRVAKAAYYNNKDNTTSFLKSNIFTNGGIRGNFFSQERLPLRSCKIKMKLSSNEASDSFLTNTFEIKKINSNKKDKLRRGKLILIFIKYFNMGFCILIWSNYLCNQYLVILILSIDFVSYYNTAYHAVCQRNRHRLKVKKVLFCV